MAIKRTLCQIFKNFTDSMITEVEFFYDNSFHLGFLSLDSETEINIFFNQNGVKKILFQYLLKVEMKCMASQVQDKTYIFLSVSFVQFVKRLAGGS